VWKNKTTVTIGILDFTGASSDDAVDAALEKAREKLTNISLSRVN
jgi:hypothetical protein